jgi:uncharacterized membrane protein
MNEKNVNLVASSTAWEWYKKSWALFLKKPLFFILQFLVFYSLQIGVQILGPLSSFASNMVWCVLAVGYYYFCERLESGQEVHFSDFFKPLETKLKPLLVLAVYLTFFLLIYLAGVVVMAVIISGASILSLLQYPLGIVEYFLANILVGVFILTLVILIPLAVLMMVSLFSPMLVYFDNLKPMEAMKKSLNACVRNSVPFLVHGLIFMGLSILALIPLAFGYFVLIPVVHISLYFAYKDIFRVSSTPHFNNF